MYLGLDLSLTATGIAELSDVGFGAITLDTGKKRGNDRLQYIRERIALRLEGCKGVGIEGYAMGAKFNREAMGELGGIVRMLLWERGVPYVNIAPNALKKFITGKGNASGKGLVMVEVYKRYQITAEDDNQADALVLAHMAEHHFTGSTCQFTYQTEALAKLETVPPYEAVVRKRSR